MADIYSLGMILFMIITGGRMPFYKQKIDDSLYSKLNKDYKKFAAKVCRKLMINLGSSKA